jgi:hypothetical protein
MWSIEINEDASEEEITSALLSEIDFDYVREKVADLRNVVEKYGPFKEIQEKTEQTPIGEPTKILNKKGDWVCEGISDLDPLKVWTCYNDFMNGYSFISPGYSEEPGRFNIVSWFISSNAVQDVDKDLVPATEYYIPHYDEDGEVVLEYRLDLWFLIKEAEASDEDILGALAY